jgi:hypothetical protein
MYKKELESVMTRIKNLREWEVVVKVPEGFSFQGEVPFDMYINNGVAYVKVLAVSLEEAVDRAKKYFNGPPEEDYL